jgi:SAM-dependent methyltransferase
MIVKLRDLMSSLRHIFRRMSKVELRLDAHVHELLEIRAKLDTQLDEARHLIMMSEGSFARRLSAELYGLDRDPVTGIDAATASAIESSRRFSHEHAEAASAAAATHAIAAAHEHASAAADVAGKNAVVVARRHAEVASDAAGSHAVIAAREHAEALSKQTLATIASEIATVRRDVRSLNRATSQGPASVAADRTEIHESLPQIDPSFYVALEDRFRGDQETIEARQVLYVPFVVDLVDDQFPLVDLGCGRGEWLRVLQRSGIPAKGIDSNPAFVAEGAEGGISVEFGDLVQYLRAANENSIGAISMFQVVEHLPFPVLMEVLGDCARVLRPGGLLLAETPNSLNLRVAASTFWIDPTHQRPLHPELLQFMAKYVGFSRVDGVSANELKVGGTELPDDPVGNAMREMRQLVDGHADFTLLAWK